MKIITIACPTDSRFSISYQQSKASVISKAKSAKLTLEPWLSWGNQKQQH